MTQLLAGLVSGLYKYDVEVGSDARPVLSGLQPRALAIDPSNPSRIYCATYNRGLWRSEDAGERWTPAGTPQDFHHPTMHGAIGPRETTFVSVDPAPGINGCHAVWVGTEPSRLYRSDDHGETFEVASALELPSRPSWSFPPRPATHHVHCIAHGADGSIHVAIEAGATLRSRDGGNSFEDRRPDSPCDAHVLLAHPLAPGRLYAALGDGLMWPGRAFAESRDDGASWRYSGGGLEAAPYLYDLAVNPRDPRDLRAAAARNPKAAHVTGGASIFRRAGEDWIEDATGFPRERSLVPVIGADPTEPGRWFALSDEGLFAMDSGVTAWTRLIAPDAWRGMHPMSLAVLQE